jgi:hypothetical protein
MVQRVQEPLPDRAQPLKTAAGTLQDRACPNNPSRRVGSPRAASGGRR